LGDGGSLVPIEWPVVYVRELIADWYGAGMAISGSNDPTPWYEANKESLVLHDDTRYLIEQMLREYFPREMP